MTRRRRGAVLEQRNSAEDMAAALFDSSSPAPARSASSQLLPRSLRSLSRPDLSPGELELLLERVRGGVVVVTGLEREEQCRKCVGGVGDGLQHERNNNRALTHCIAAVVASTRSFARAGGSTAAGD